MATRRPGTEPNTFDATPETSPDVTVPAKAPPPPALPRRPATGLMALDVSIPATPAPPRHREGSAAIALGALMREHGVEADEPEERTAITTSAPTPPADDPLEGLDEPTAISTIPGPPAAAPVQHRPGSGAIALDELMRQNGVPLPRTATPVMSRPGSAAMALGDLMREHGVERPLPPSAEPDPFEAAPTIVGALPDAEGPSAWDEAAPTEVLTLPPRK
jgi:hypothetical protein